MSLPNHVVPSKVTNYPVMHVMNILSMLINIKFSQRRLPFLVRQILAGFLININALEIPRSHVTMKENLKVSFLHHVLIKKPKS